MTKVKWDDNINFAVAKKVEACRLESENGFEKKLLTSETKCVKL